MDQEELPYMLLGILTSTRREAMRIVDELVKKGQSGAKADSAEKAGKTPIVKRGEDYINELIEKGRTQQDDFISAIYKEVKDVLDAMGIVTKSDLDKIEQRLSKIEKKL